MIFILTGSDAALEPLVQKIYKPTDQIKIGPGQWLLSDDISTSRDVWDKLVAGVEPAPTGIVFPVTNGYYGLAPSSVWEWLTTKRQTAALI
jgi:hypothetical protein